jgi:hypothetical protein
VADRLLNQRFMDTNTLLPAGQWSQDEFGFAELGDPRRTKRLVQVGAMLAANPGGTLPQAFPDWAELKGAYRLLDNPAVRYEQVLRPHLERTRLACCQAGEYLIIEDTTDLDYSGHPCTEGLGVIGDGRGKGFELHSALAVRVAGWTLEQRPEGVVVGLFGQQCRCPVPVPKGEQRREVYQRRHKSEWWAEAFLEAGGPPEGSRWIYVADRESDAYEPIQICQEQGVDFVIRGYHDRRLADEAGRLRAALSKAGVVGQATVEVRARGSEPARTAVVEMSALRVDLDGPWRPSGWQAPLRGVWVLEVREKDAPEGVKEPLHWILLTSLPCETLTAARRVVGYYAARWWVEEYHKALKSGTGVEESQLEREGRLRVLIAVLAVVAVRLLNTKLLARSRPAGGEAVESFGPQALELLERRYGRPKEGWTNQSVLIATARLGGFLARKHDGMPGWQTIWRGWHRLMWMCEGLDLFSRG